MTASIRKHHLANGCEQLRNRGPLFDVEFPSTYQIGLVEGKRQRGDFLLLIRNACRLSQKKKKKKKINSKHSYDLGEN